MFRVALPLGFSAGGVNCGVKSYRPDLGVVLSDSDCVASGVFTKNVCKAAPLSYCEAVLPATNIRAIITNSGQANAATGKLGVVNNQKMADAVAKGLSCDSHQVLTASTGVIGQHLSIDKITAAVPELLSRVSNSAQKFALAILTTDLVPKSVTKTVKLSGGEVTITGICKGSGMIHPNMATMLGYLLTDASLTLAQSQTMLTTCCDQSFNMISVDGDTSTNDCVFLLSNGNSGVALANQQDSQLFYQALEAVAVTLAKSIARDGEGASKLIEVSVSGVDDKLLAKQLAKSVVMSPLVKTAVYGESPNWGRILAKIGGENISESMLNHCRILIQGVLLFSEGEPVDEVDLTQLALQMKEDTVSIEIVFVAGDASARAWGCDFSEKYVKINAGYLS